MSLRIRNSWNYTGDKRWDWEAFIDDDGSGELEDVEYVEYILHPTFRNPIRRVDDSSNGFRMKTNGWGTFLIKAFVHKKDESKVRLTHEIMLSYEPISGITE